MGTECTVIVKGRPVPKERPKFGKGKVFTPQKTVNQEEQIKWEYMLQNGRMLSEAIEVECRFIYEPPKSLSKKRRAAMMGTPRLAKPDNDNLVKLCLDALNGVAYTDDTRIWKIISEKIYGPESMTIIHLREVESNG